jgi:hypothetical protein
MSARNPMAGHIASNDHQTTQSTKNIFQPVFDGEEESDDEWWDEEESVQALPESTSTARSTNRLEVSGNTAVASSAKPTPYTSIRRVEKRYSVQKPVREKSKGRQRKQNALAGIKVVTNFNKNEEVALPVQPQQPKPQPPVGRFVDLASLQALGGEPSEASGALGFWKSRKNRDLKRAQATVSSMSKDTSKVEETVPNKGFSQSKKGNGLVPPPLELDLSPSDRPIVIGISIPSARLAEHSMSPQTAATETSKSPHNYGIQTPSGQTPETPSIIITPAHDGSIWSALDDNTSGYGRRPASSIYSLEPHNAIGLFTKPGAPPVPQMPASVLEKERQRVAAEKSYFSPDSDEGSAWNDADRDVKSRSRAFSTGTVFEEDESPIIARTGRAVSVSTRSRPARPASIGSEENRRRSKGWWNYILNTPFISRSNTVAQRGVFEDQLPPPAMPNLATAAAKAQEAEQEREGKVWEKNFSPLTPETTTTTFSDSWWDESTRENESKHPKSPEHTPDVKDIRHRGQPSVNTMPFVLSEVATLGGRIMSTLPTVDSNPQLDQNESSFEIDRERATPSDQPNSRKPQTTGSTNPFVQPRLGDLTSNTRPLRAAVDRQGAQPLRPVLGAVPLPTPPPPYSPPPSRTPRYRAILPPNLTQNLQYPVSPGPMTPGLQQAMSSRGAIPMSDVPLTPASSSRTPISSQYPELPPRETPMVFDPPPRQALSSKAKKAETKRRRHEKEDAIAHRAGGWWRGRGCISERGCYGRSGAEGRKKRRCCCGLIAGFFAIIVLAVVLATTLHRKPNTIIGPSQWLNLTGFPPIFTGLSTVADPANIKTNTGCVVPSTAWSCDLPKELQASFAPNPSNQPNFLLQIQWDNSSSTNATFANVTGNPQLGTRTLVGNPVSAGQFMKHIFLKARQIVSFTPNPAPPSFAEEFFLGNTTDGIVSPNKAGEPTPFYISFLSPTSSSLTKRELPARDTSPFPNVSAAIPAPSLNKDGTAQPANLLPSSLPSQQPIRLFDRGLPTEHYGFYTYFDRSIFLKSMSPVDGSGTGPVPADENGGSTEGEAEFRCTWTQTRFLVQMWTRRTSTARLLNSTSSTTQTPGKNFTQPGTFPYPITITIDRHGGDPTEKVVYCYPMDARGGMTLGTGKLEEEVRDFGGTAFNPAPQAFNNQSDPSLGGFDGGTGGCSCQWSNFINLN